LNEFYGHKTSCLFNQKNPENEGYEHEGIDYLFLKLSRFKQIPDHDHHNVSADYSIKDKDHKTSRMVGQSKTEPMEGICINNHEQTDSVNNQ
jgi:hypothetical protein